MKRVARKTIQQTIQPTLTGKVFMLAMGEFFLSTIAGTLGAVCDGFIIGQTREVVEIGAISLTAPLFFFLSMIWALLATGSHALCVKRLARGRINETRDIISATLLLGMAIAVVFTLAVIIFSNGLTQVLGAEPDMDVFKPCRRYLAGTAIGIPAMAVIGLSSFVLNLEKKRRWFVCSIAVMCLTNTGLDLIAHHTHHGNMYVAGITTAIGYYAGALVLLICYSRLDFRLKPRFAKPPKHVIGSILRGGTSIGVSRLTGTCKLLLINNLLASSVTVAGLAAYNVQVQVNYIADALIMGSAQAVVMLAGIYYAEEDRKGLRRAIRIALRYVILIGLGVFILINFEPVIDAITVFYLGKGEDGVIYAVASVAVYFFAVGLLGQALAVLLANYLETIGHRIMSYIVYILDDIVFVLIAVSWARRSDMFTNDTDISIVASTFIGLFIAQIVMVLSIPILLLLFNLIINRRVVFGWDAILMLPKGFGVSKDNELTAAVFTVEEATEFASKAYEFCMERGVPQRKAYVASLAVEELSSQIIERGFSDGKAHRLELHLVCKGEELILRTRDDCRQFDPWAIAGQADDEEMSEEISETTGIRMIREMATEVNYTSAMKLNNLTIRV